MLILEHCANPSKRNYQILLDMKRKYCLVRYGGDLGIGSFVYVVWVGSSLRESVLLSLVEEFCKDCGWYFKQWCAAVDSALQQRTKLTRVDGTRSATPYQMIQLNIQQCYDTIIDDSWSTLEANRVMTPQEKFMRFRRDPNFLMAMNNKKRNTTCPPFRRKYLSHRKQSEAIQAVCGIVSIILLIVADAIVSSLIL